MAIKLLYSKGDHKSADLYHKAETVMRFGAAVATQYILERLTEKDTSEKSTPPTTRSFSVNQSERQLLRDIWLL
jgi:hypothetical protein